MFQEPIDLYTGVPGFYNRARTGSFMKFQGCILRFQSPLWCSRVLYWGSRVLYDVPGLYTGVPGFFMMFLGCILGFQGPLWCSRVVYWGSRVLYDVPGLYTGVPGSVWCSRVLVVVQEIHGVSGPYLIFLVPYCIKVFQGFNWYSRVRVLVFLGPTWCSGGMSLCSRVLHDVPGYIMVFQCPTDVPESILVF